jgi:hypothetical protein
MFDELNGLRSRTANHEPDNHINFHRERHFHLPLFALVRIGRFKNDNLPIDRKVPAEALSKVRRIIAAKPQHGCGTEAPPRL